MGGSKHEGPRGCASREAASPSRLFSARVAAAVVVPILLLVSSPAAAFDARVAFNPVAGAAGYRILVGFDDAPWEAPLDVGRPKPEFDGAVRVVVESLPLGPDVRIAVVAYDAEALESAPSNEMVVTYAQAAAVTDSDGDGITDALEDADLDGEVDPGETDPHLADTDGDGRDDGVELAQGTDPTVPDEAPSAVCGDGRVDDGEECDDGNDSDADACLGDCRRATCGDGVVHDGVEECDDGAANSDIADASCRTDCTLPACLPSTAEAACDDGDVCTDDACSGGSCAHSHNTATCDDGVACTRNDACASGQCMGVDACSAGKYCNLTTGACERLADANTGLWFPAALYPAAEFDDGMATSPQFADGDDDDEDADSLSALLVYPDPEADAAGETVYTVYFPRAGNWYLWGRFYYPSDGHNGANSFWVRVEDGPDLKFGNNKDFFQRWHWDGDGSKETGSPEPLALGYLEAGLHRIAIRKRELDPEPPRLDMLFLVRDREVVPTDEAAAASLAKCPFGGCNSNPRCGDATHNHQITSTDAWIILNAAVGLGRSCRRSLCDVDANGHIQTSDAMAVLSAAVGLTDARSFACRPAIAFGLGGATAVDRVSFLVDYSRAGISMADDAGVVTCQTLDPGRTVHLEASDRAGTGRLELVVELSEPIDGDAELVECRGYPPAGTQLPGPGAFSVEVLGVRSRDAKAPLPTVSVLPGG